MTNRPNDPGQSHRQDVYLRALRTLPRVEIIEGQFQQRAKMVFLADRTGFVKALVSEEKGSDVNLGTDLVWDALKEPDLVVARVLSNDFDLQRPVRRAISVGIEVLVVNPHRSGGQRPKVKGSGTRNLREWHLRDHQLPETVYDSSGRAIRRPVEWRKTQRPAEGRASQPTPRGEPVGTFIMIQGCYPSP